MYIALGEMVMEPSPLQIIAEKSTAAGVTGEPTTTGTGGVRRGVRTGGVDDEAGWSAVPSSFRNRAPSESPSATTVNPRAWCGGASPPTVL